MRIQNVTFGEGLPDREIGEQMAIFRSYVLAQCTQIRLNYYRLACDAVFHFIQAAVACREKVVRIASTAPVMSGLSLRLLEQAIPF